VNNLFINLIYYQTFTRLTFGAYSMDNVHVTKSASAAMAAILVFGAVAAGLIAAPQTAYAAVSIETSSDTFYGTGFVRVEITDTAKDDDNDTISPSVDVEGDEFILNDIESIGTSGTFEFFITTSGGTLAPANPSYDDEPALGGETGPFIVSIFDGAADGTVADGAGATIDANGNDLDLGINRYGIDVDLEEGDEITISYGGQEATITFEPTTAQITADRTEAGDDNEIILQIADQDANADPTLRDEFTFADETLVDSTSDLEYDSGVWRETSQNSGVFELVETLTVDNDNDDGDVATTTEINAELPTGNTFTANDLDLYEDLDDVTGVDVVFDDDFDGLATIDGTGTDSVSVTLRNRDGSLVLLETPTLRNGLMLQLTDPDRNISTEDEDTVDADVEFAVDFNEDGDTADAGETDTTFTFVETGDNTGIFVPDYDRDLIAITLAGAGAGDFDGATGEVTLEFAAGEFASDDEIVITYTDPAFASDDESSVNAELDTTIGTISTEIETSTSNQDVEITVTDDDLNTNSDTIETYDVSDGDFEIGGVVVGELVIEAGAEDDILGLGGVDATFIETGPDTGIFVADDIDMTDIDDNADTANDGDTGNLEDGDDVDFTYNDLMEDPDEDSDVTIQIGIPPVSIDVDRSTVPVPIPDGDPVTIIITVVDPQANANPGSTETVDIELGDITGEDGDNTELGDDLADGDATDVEDFTGLVAAIELTETGPNTGIFEEEVELESGVDENPDLDDLIDAQITFFYDNDDTDEDDEVTITYRSYDGSISVTPAVVGPGGEFDVTVTDQDLNKDPDTAETVDVAFETDEDTDDGDIELTETGPNTGVFTETVEVGVDIVVSDIGADNFSSEITLTYVDEVTSAGDEDEDRETTVRVATSTGQLSVAPEVVGPGTEVTLTLIDTDLNEDPDSSDDLDGGTVELSSSDGDDADIAFEETGPNTGIFEATIQFDPRDPDEDGAATAGDGTDDLTYTALPGDVIAFRYEDESTSSGGSTVVSLTIEITSQDPTMEAASPTVQIGGTIALTIEDADANRDADSVDSVDVDITSDSDAVGFTLSALETGEDTGIFTVNIPTSESVTSGSITVGAGDDVFLEYEDEFPADYADRVDSVLDPSKDFVLVVPVGSSGVSDVTATTPEPVVPRDISGEELEEVSAGQQVVLSSIVNNNRSSELDYAAIIEVQDADGFTVLLQWATGTLPANGENSVGLSWTPTEPGTYTVRTFVLSEIGNPAALSQITESTLTVS
jgi:hypothetical protein